MSPIVLDQPMPRMSGVHPALRCFAEECSAIFVRILAYICGLAVLASIAVDLFATVPAIVAAPVMPTTGWAPATKPHPAFAITQVDLSARSDAYEILRHPDGGRKDILHWAATATDPVASEIEIYRPGAEIDAFAAPDTGLAERVGLGGDTEAAGVIDTKFGPVALLRFAGAEAAKTRSCVGFAKVFEGTKIRLSGWTCQGDTVAAQRANLACTLNRLTMLSAGNDPKIAELFARAELKRTSCTPLAAPAADWIAAPQDPRLRGSI
jgi:hypothetical protein